jgi:hypothetical protein
VSNSGSVVHIQDVCRYSNIFLDWDLSSNSIAIYNAGNTYIGLCYYNYRFVDNCIYPGSFLSVYNTYTCITFLCNSISKRSIPENTTADSEAIPGTLPSIGDSILKRSQPESTTADSETIPGTLPSIGQE